MSCLDCPYHIVDYNFRDNGWSQFDEWVKKYADDTIWCDKVGGRIRLYGSCEDAYFDDEEIPTSIMKKQRIHKYERYLKYQHHLRYLERVSCGYPPAVTYEDEIRIRRQCYVPNPKPYYKRRYRGHRSKILKQQSNKRIRRYKGELKNGWQCHKIYDFWWEWN